MVSLGVPEPRLFAAWSFFDQEAQYTPVAAAAPEAEFDSSAFYRIRLDDPTLDFLSGQRVMVDFHLVSGPGECRRVAEASLRLAEVLAYPTNKLHGSAILYAPSSPSDKSKQGGGEGRVMGTMDYWFKLHTAATQRIQQWLEHKREVERMLEAAEEAARREKNGMLSEVDLLKGEGRLVLLNEH